MFGQLNLTLFGPYKNTFRDLQRLLMTPAGMRALGSTAIMTTFGSQFGVIDVTDVIDMLDSPDGHLAERAALVTWLQSWAQARGVRVTYLGGDSHLGYAGRFYTAGFTGIPENDPKCVAAPPGGRAGMVCPSPPSGHGGPRSTSPHH